MYAVKRFFEQKPINKCLYLCNNSPEKSFIMSVLKQVAEYLYLKKKDPNEQPTQWMKYMHGINRLSIFLFLIAMIILAIKLIRH